jgi:acyl-CoA synthetase (AMP-forming)/AMP-acid ligase II
MQATPATWRMLIEAGWQGAPGFRVLCGGEALSRDLADALLARAGEVWNLYVPTETTIWSTVEQVLPGPEPISIGRPIANTQVHVLDQRGLPTPVGIPGELCIGGAGVALGYHNRPELTSERFVPDPFTTEPGARMYRTGDRARWRADGRLECLGRLDHQVKIRGFRIELGEIESILGSHPAVRQVTVVPRDAAPGDTRLVAYVVYQEGEDLTVSEARRFLRRDLPDYMIPSLVVPLEALPLTANGKVDRLRLPDPYGRAIRTDTPREPPAPGAEQSLAEVWQEILQVPEVSADDNFFELGGHSLLALRAAMLFEKRTGRRLDPRTLFFQSLRQVAQGAAMMSLLSRSAGL